MTSSEWNNVEHLHLTCLIHGDFSLQSEALGVQVCLNVLQRCNFICACRIPVTNQTTSNTRAAVRKLNSAQVSALVGQPDVTLDRLHRITEEISTDAKDGKIKRKTKSVSNLNLLHLIPDI